MKGTLKPAHGPPTLITDDATTTLRSPKCSLGSDIQRRHVPVLPFEYVRWVAAAHSEGWVPAPVNRMSAVSISAERYGQPECLIRYSSRRGALNATHLEMRAECDELRKLDGD